MIFTQERSVIVLGNKYFRPDCWTPEALAVSSLLHTFEGTRGLYALRPEFLNYELRWVTSSRMILSDFDLTRLKATRDASEGCPAIRVSRMRSSFLEMVS